MDYLTRRELAAFRVVVTPYGRLSSADLGLVSDLLRDAALDREQRLPFDPALVLRMIRLADTFENLSEVRA